MSLTHFDITGNQLSDDETAEIFRKGDPRRSRICWAASLGAAHHK